MMNWPVPAIWDCQVHHPCLRLDKALEEEISSSEGLSIMKEENGDVEEEKEEETEWRPGMRLTTSSLQTKQK